MIKQSQMQLEGFSLSRVFSAQGFVIQIIFMYVTGGLACQSLMRSAH